MHVVFSERAERYKSHPAFRVFVGAKPWVVTADPESSRRLMTRLLNRARFAQVAEEESSLGGGRDLATLRGERWRRMRLAWLPAFSPPSLAAYAPLMDGCAKRLADRLDEPAASGEAVDVWRLIGSLTLDVVGTTAFGTRFNALAADGEEQQAAAAGEEEDGDDDDEDHAFEGKRLVAAARDIFARGSITTGSLYQALIVMFPLGTPLWQAMSRVLPDRSLRELNAARRVVSDAAKALLARQRRRDEREAAAAAAAAAAAKAADGAKAAKDDDDDTKAGDGGDQKEKKQADVSKGILPGSFLAQLLRPAPAPRGASAADAPPPLEDVDAIAQASLFVLAGYETTANTVYVFF
jgi:thromboxane-A synthase/cytochrome P450 family 3 subfamily A